MQSGKHQQNFPLPRPTSHHWSAPESPFHPRASKGATLPASDLGTAGCFLPFGSIFPAAYFSVRPLYFREIFRRKFIFFNRSHTHQTTKEVQTHSHLPSRTRTYAARQEDDGRERRRDAGAPLRHARSATARALREWSSQAQGRRQNQGFSRVTRAYFPGSKSYFLAGVGIFPPIFPEIENDKRRLISDKFSGKIQPCQSPLILPNLASISANLEPISRRSPAEAASWRTCCF